MYLKGRTAQRERPSRESEIFIDWFIPQMGVMAGTGAGLLQAKANSFIQVSHMAAGAQTFAAFPGAS